MKISIEEHRKLCCYETHTVGQLSSRTLLSKVCGVSTSAHLGTQLFNTVMWPIHLLLKLWSVNEHPLETCGDAESQAPTQTHGIRIYILTRFFEWVVWTIKFEKHWLPHTRHEKIDKEYPFDGCNTAVNTDVSIFAQSNLSIRKQLSHQTNFKFSSHCLSKTGKKTDLEQRAQMRKDESPCGKQLKKNWYLTLEVFQ